MSNRNLDPQPVSTFFSPSSTSDYNLRITQAKNASTMVKSPITYKSSASPNSGLNQTNTPSCLNGRQKLISKKLSTSNNPVIEQSPSQVERGITFRMGEILKDDKQQKADESGYEQRLNQQFVINQLRDDHLNMIKQNYMIYSKVYHVQLVQLQPVFKQHKATPVKNQPFPINQRALDMPRQMLPIGTSQNILRSAFLEDDTPAFSNYPVVFDENFEQQSQSSTPKEEQGSSMISSNTSLDTMTMNVMFSNDPSQARFSLQPSKIEEMKEQFQEVEEVRVLQMRTMPFNYIVESQPYLETHLDSRERLDVVFEQDESSSRVIRKSDAVTPRYIETEGASPVQQIAQIDPLFMNNFTTTANSLGSTIQGGHHRHKSSIHAFSQTSEVAQVNEKELLSIVEQKVSLYGLLSDSELQQVKSRCQQSHNYSLDFIDGIFCAVQNKFEAQRNNIEQQLCDQIQLQTESDIKTLTYNRLHIFILYVNIAREKQQNPT